MNGSPFGYYTGCWKQYVKFSGRASRSEYWFFVLFNFLISIGVGVIDGAIGAKGALCALYNLAVMLPGLAVMVRRLHDTDRSGWWFWIVLIPIIGWIFLLVFLIQNTRPGSERFGE